MRYQYVVILKKDSERTIDFLSLLLCFISILAFIYSAGNTLFVQKIHNARTYSTFIFVAILFIGLLVNLITWRRTGHRLRYRYLLLAAAVGWFALTNWPWMAAVFPLLAFLEHQTRRPMEVGFHYDRVVINTLVKERHAWREFNNIVLKDGLLTLDFKNNRLFQKEVVDDDDEDNADEEEFNAFCRDRLQAVTA
ncbi:MAG TPA: hypothetical protein VGM30_09880 [Puia sp.]|jgi:hypothetical protein